MVIEIFFRPYLKEDGDDLFFNEWYKAILNDFDRFQYILLENYIESKDRASLLSLINFIKKSIKENIKNTYEVSNDHIMQSTPNYFLFSFADYTTDDMTVYVLLSKDYKKIFLGKEVMECFDDLEFNEELRYGIYEYYCFILDGKNVRLYFDEQKQYTSDYRDIFMCPIGDGKESDIYCDNLFMNKVKKISKSK